MERSAFGVIHKALPKGLLFHGTHNAATPPKTLGELKTRLKARKAERDHARLLNDIDL